MARGSLSQPDSPITIRHPERHSIVLDGSDAPNNRESRSESSSATLLEMDTVDEPRKLDYQDIEKQAEDGSRPKLNLGNTRARLTSWMTLNTIATVAIVRIAVHTTQIVSPDCSAGLHEQSHLRRSYFSPFSGCLCHFPPLHHRYHALPPLSALCCPLRPKPDASPPNAPTRNDNVPQRHLPEPIPDLLLHHLLPNRPYSLHPHGRPHQFPLLPEIHTAKRRIHPPTHVPRRLHHLLLRAQIHRPPRSRANNPAERLPGADKRLHRLHLHRLDRLLPTQIRNERLPAPLQPSAHRRRYAHGAYPLDRQTPRGTRSTGQ